MTFSGDTAAEGSGRKKREERVARMRNPSWKKRICASNVAKRRKNLLELDLGASGLELLFDILGLGLRNVLLDVLGSAFDEVLGLF